MKPQRDILDFVNTGANVLQAVKLSEINAELRSMAKTEAEKEQRTQLQRHLRQTLIEQEEVIEAASESLQKSPESAYAQLRLVQYLFEKAEFKPSLFDAWDDIDRAKAVIKKLDMVTDRAGRRVTKDFANEVTECLRFTEEVSQLEELIRLARLRDDWIERKKALEEMDRKLQNNPAYTSCRLMRKFRNGLGWLAFLFGIVFFAIGLFGSEAPANRENPPAFIRTVIIVFFASTASAIVAHYCLKGSSAWRECEELDHKVKVERACVDIPVDNARIIALSEKFGGDGPYTKFVGIAEDRSKRWRQIFSSVPLDRPLSLESS